jgi:predicted O-linked N-acetylglucosamine transferase (SPINDLY family)
MNPQLQAVFQQVIQAFQAGNFDGADLILQEILQKDINSADAIFDFGIACAEANRFKEALIVLYCLKLYKRDDIRIPYNIGAIHSLENNHKLALEAYDFALKLQPDCVEAMINIGAIHNEMKDYVLALEVLDRAIKLNENYYEAYSNKGNALLELKRYEDAIKNYDKALSLRLDYCDVWTNKGAALKELKRYDEAIAHLDKALSLRPRDIGALINRGSTLFELKRYDEAISDYDEALSLKPDYAQTWSNKGVALKELKQYDEAIAHFDKALSLKSDYHEAWTNKGVTLHELKRYNEAIAHFDKALSLKPDYHEAWTNKGVTLHELKCYDEAIAHYDKALSFELNYSLVWSNKGVVLKELKRYDDAIAHFDKALSLKSDYHEALTNKGVTLYELKRYDEAIANYDKALSLKPDYAEAWSNKGVTLCELKCYDEAIAHYDKALSLKTDYHEAWTSKGVALHELKYYDEAIAHYDKALSIKSDYHGAWTSKGVTLHELKQFDEAIAHYDKALSLKTDYHEAWTSKGVALHELKRYDGAIVHFDKALSLKPDYAEAWSNKGVTLHELKQFDEAIAHYEKAFSLKLDYHEAWTNKGVTLHELKCYDEAIAHFDRALSLKPDYAEAWSNKGVTLHELKQFDEAIAHYEKAFNLKPDIDWIYGDLLHTKMKVCSWRGLSDFLENIYKKMMANETVSQPFSLLALNDDALLHKKASKIYVQDKYPWNPALGSIPKHPKKQKIRLGYFSADFHNHATGYLIAELFELHDKSEFELVAFSFGPIANDEMRQRLERPFDQFIEVGYKSDMEIAQLSRDLNIDIAVDLKGFTTDSRTGIFANHAAPIQVNYLGYPGTMGADYMDYIIADRTLIPQESQPFYLEKVVYLPNSYQVNDRKRLISDRQFTRQELGLPENGFVFCCFNNNYKILPATFDGWMRILKAVEGSVLWLLQDNSWAVENLKKEAQKQGIDAQRLVFADRERLSEHLARHRQGNLFLDTFPCNAHTTTSDALWVGLPVLTLMGQSFASRVAASLLDAIGLPELITSTQEEYEALAIELALNPTKLADIKLKLANNRLTSPLFDTPLFTKNLETAYIKMVERYQADLPPDHILV